MRPARPHITHAVFEGLSLNDRTVVHCGSSEWQLRSGRSPRLRLPRSLQRIPAVPPGCSYLIAKLPLEDRALCSRPQAARSDLFRTSDGCAHKLEYHRALAPSSDARPGRERLMTTVCRSMRRDARDRRHQARLRYRPLRRRLWRSCFGVGGFRRMTSRTPASRSGRSGRLHVDFRPTRLRSRQRRAGVHGTGSRHC